MTDGPVRAVPRPLAAAAATGGLVVVVALLIAGDVLPTLTVAGFVAGRARSRRVAVAGLVVVLAAAATAAMLSTDNDEVPLVMLPVTLWCTGLALRGRDHVAEHLREQGRELEAEREAFAQLSVRYERARIAAELHDVVAHAISVMVVQASAGQRLVGAAPEAAQESFRVIGDAARQAEADLGRLAALLAADPSSGPGADFGLVEAVVARAAEAGLGVTLRLEGDREALRGTAAHAASRVVQEGLTNALRYAPGAEVRVLVRAAPSTVTVEVANGAAPAGGRPLGLGSGRGLTGLRERVEASGGRLQAAPHGAGWRLAAHLPAGVRPPAAVRSARPAHAGPADAPVAQHPAVHGVGPAAAIARQSTSGRKR